MAGIIEDWKIDSKHIYDDDDDDDDDERKIMFVYAMDPLLCWYVHTYIIHYKTFS